MAIKIKLYDYYDPWFGVCGIGMGNNDATVVCDQIDAAVAAKQDIEVDIHSGGGFVFAGWNIYNKLIEAKATVKVTTINSGVAASIASIIFMAGTVRVMAKASLTMIHKPTIDPYYYGSMDADDLKREAASLDQIQAVLADVYVTTTGLDLDSVNSMINAETWLTPNECEALGFSTETRAEAAASKIDIEAEAMNHIFAKAPQNVRIYANQIFNSIKSDNMNNKETNALLAENNGLLKVVANGLRKAFGGKAAKNASTTLKDGTVIYHEGDLAVDVEVYTDEEMLLPVDDGTYTLADDSTFVVAAGVVTELNAAEAAADGDAENADELAAANALLEAENLELKATNQRLVTALQASNAALKKVQNATTTYKPKDRTQDFGEDKDKPNADQPVNKFAHLRKPKASEAAK